MSPTAIFLFKWLQQNASSRAKSGTDRGSETRAERRGQMIYWKRLLLGAAERECKDGQWAKVRGETVSDEPDWELFMAWGGRADLRTAPGRILKFSLMSFCSPLMAIRPRQWGAEGVGGEGWEEGGGGSGVEGVIYFTTMSPFMGHTTRDGLKCYCPQEEDQHALPKCYSSSDRLTHLMSAPPGFICLHQPQFTIPGQLTQRVSRGCLKGVKGRITASRLNLSSLQRQGADVA